MVFCIIIGAQVSSIVNTGDYIIPLTLSNLSGFHAVGYKVVLQTLAIIVLDIICSLFIYKSDTNKSKKISFLFLLCFFYYRWPGASSCELLSSVLQATYLQT